MIDPKITRTTRVLIIEHQSMDQGHIKYALQELGFQRIAVAVNVDDAEIKINDHKFDVILCAYDLEKTQDGYFLYEKLKAHKQIPPDVAFLFISAETTPDIVHSIVELQPDDFLAKPFSVSELEKRLEKILRRKSVLKPALALMGGEKYIEALSEVDSVLTQKNLAEFFPYALRIKGELLLTMQRFDEAKEFYQAVLNVQHFNWAHIGLIQTFIALDMDDEAEKNIIDLAFKPESSLAAYDLLASLHMKREDYDDALESVLLARDISPRNQERNKQAFDLSRIVHDYSGQFEAAKHIVKMAKNSLYDKPEHYLNVARAGIDYAMTTQDDGVTEVLHQSQDYLKQLKRQHPKANVAEALTVIQARQYYLKDDIDNAKALLNQLNDAQWEADPIESLLDKAKAFHEVGLHDHALNILDEIESRCEQNPNQGALFLRYIQNQKAEKSAIRMTPKELNNDAVSQYDKGDITNALRRFREAFTLMPKNPSIALNLLQATVVKMREHTLQLDEFDQQRPMIFQCMETLENSSLTDEQIQRYDQIRMILQQWLN